MYATCRESTCERVACAAGTALWVVVLGSTFGGGGDGAQGLTLVHFSAQLEPFLSLKPCNHPTYPTKLFTSSRNVEGFQPLA
jgi:hypothetical protein